jgi:hypothetical protein
MMQGKLRESGLLLVAAVLLSASGAGQAQDRSVYRCPGNLYTDQITPKEAAERGCKTLDGALVTVVQGSGRKPAAGAASGASGAAGRADARIDPADQRARDSDARRILVAELSKEEDKLAQLRKDYNGGSPERRGEERNFARYQERVAELKAAIDRKEADIAAIKRELAKLPAP